MGWRRERFWARVKQRLENSHCSLTIDLLRWRLWLWAGTDFSGRECVEQVWFYCDLGPLALRLALGNHDEAF